MSTYIESAIDPEDSKARKAWFIDDYYGQHNYGVAFRKDGKDAIFENRPINRDEYCIYPIEQITLAMYNEERR